MLANTNQSRSVHREKKKSRKQNKFDLFVVHQKIKSLNSKINHCVMELESIEQDASNALEMIVNEKQIDTKLVKTLRNRLRNVKNKYAKYRIEQISCIDEKLQLILNSNIKSKKLHPPCPKMN